LPECRRRTGVALLAACVCALSAGARAEPAGAVLAPSAYLSQDTEDLRILKLGAGVLPLYEDGNHYTGVMAANHHYSAGDWAKDATQVTLKRTSIHSVTGLGYRAGLGLSDLGGRQLTTADIDYSFALNASTSAGLAFFRDWVETRNSLENGVYLNYFGGSLEHRYGNGWTVIGLLGQHRFSDDNIRTHARARVILDLLPQQGINVQFRHRHFWDSNPPNGNYFNPDVYYENMVAVGMRRKVAGWFLSGTLGIGRQKVSTDPETTTHLAEFEAVSPLAERVFFRGGVGFSDGVTFAGPDFIHRYLQAELIFTF